MHALIMDSKSIFCKDFYHYDAKMSIHSVIRANRLRLKLTEQQLAERCGVSRPAVQQWEKEGGTAPKRAIQPLVAQALGVSLSELLETGVAAVNVPAGVSESIEQLGQLLAAVDPATRETIATLLADMARHPERAPQIAAAVKAVSAIKPAATVEQLFEKQRQSTPLTHTVSKPLAHKKASK